MIKKNISNIFYKLYPFRILFKKYIKKHIVYIVFSIFLMIVISVSTSGIVYIVGPLINKVFVDKNKHQLILICSVLILLYAIKTICCYFQTVCTRFLCEKVTMDIRVDIFKKIIKMPMKEFDRIQSGKMISMFLDNAGKIGDGVERLFLVFFRDFTTVVLLSIVVFYNNFVLAFFSLLIYPVIFFPFKKIKATIAYRFTENQEYLQMLTERLNDTISGIKTIKSYNNEFLEVCKMNKLLISLIKSSLNIIKKRAIVSPSVEFISGLSLSLVIFVGGWQVINRYSDVGSFFSFFTALIMAHRPARSLSGVGVDFVLCSTLLQRVFLFIKTTNVEVLNEGTKPDFVNSTIKFENVWFSYNEGDDELKNDKRFLAVSNINLEIKPRQKIAFVGSSGSGKSTIVDLLIRLYDCQEGQIIINGENINNMSLSHLRKNIACVRQDNFLFNDTIENNILYGSENKKDDYKIIDEVIKLAQIDFLSESDYGIKKNVGRDGCCFSFGQQQRMAIARAIIKDAPIVIFDEATSALDLETERKIYDVIFNKMKDKTVIIVAHRLSTIIGCDVIYVFNDGKIVESGTHDQLLGEQGFYKNLWQNLEKTNF